MPVWRNWAGSVACNPRRMERPASEEALRSIVRRVAADGGTLRVVGAGHSFSPLCATDDTLVSLDGLQGVIAVDRPACTATIWAGTRISHLGAPLLAEGLAMENQGDVDYQTLAGAICTGTHGTGAGFGSLSSRVTALRLVLASGEVVTCSATEEPDLFQAARLSLGALGVITQITMRLEPAFRLHERTWVASFDETMGRLDELIRDNEHFEFFWLPRYDASVIKTLNRTTGAPFGGDLHPPGAPGTLERYARPERVDWSYTVFPSERTTAFVEVEFAVPFRRGPDCFREIRQLLREKHAQVTWAVEYRTLRADDLYLSPSFLRDSVTISVHQAADRPYRAFFDDVQAIFRQHDGRPHWGKLHTHRADELRGLYPLWDRFQRARERVDPEGTFLNQYLRGLLVAD